MAQQGQHSNTEMDRNGSNYDKLVQLSAQLRECAEELDYLVSVTCQNGDTVRANMKPLRLSQVQHRLKPSQVDALVDRYQAGATLRQLTRAFHITQTTVIAHLDRRGVARRHLLGLSPSETEAAAELYAEGLSLAAVGQRLGFDRKTVRKALAASGVTIRSARGAR